MAKTKHNLLAIASDYVQRIAREYPERAQFAYEQVFDDQLVKLTHLYQDDVDICFVFDVSGFCVESLKIEVVE